MNDRNDQHHILEQGGCTTSKTRTHVLQNVRIDLALHQLRKVLLRHIVTNQRQELVCDDRKRDAISQEMSGEEHKVDVGVVVAGDARLGGWIDKDLVGVGSRRGDRDEELGEDVVGEGSGTVEEGVDEVWKEKGKWAEKEESEASQPEVDKLAGRSKR
jgi:hypothetical protein